MLEIEVSRESARALEEQLFAMSGDKVHVAMSRAAKRAASHAKSIGTKHVRQTYTIDAASVKAATSIKSTQDGAVLRIAGPRKSAGHYKAKKRKGGIFVSIKKGIGDIVPRKVCRDCRLSAFSGLPCRSFLATMPSRKRLPTRQ